ncbi:MAG TPA: Gfo/Idh/MocA family oxidoreductase [Fimbriimonas sp.]|nr:Gfo/Idh/MocA family oxidoreductase [Fimbriimonas sp.]
METGSEGVPATPAQGVHVIRIGFVGVGSMGQCAHLKHYASLAGCQVAAIAEPRTQLAQKVAARYGVARVYADATSMIETERLDALVAIQRFEQHGSVVLPLYRFGLPILTEKPLASSVPVGEQMLAALAQGGSWHMVGYHKRSDPATAMAVREIAKLKDSKELGPLRYVRITMPEGDWIAGGFDQLLTTDEPPPDLPLDPPPPGMDSQTFQRYVSFVNYYIHQVNLMRLLLGEPYRVVFAESSQTVMVVQSESGIAGVLEMSPYKTTLGWDETALVGFDRGYVRIGFHAPLASAPGVLEIGRDNRVTRIELEQVSAMRRQAMNFVAAVRGEAKPPCEAHEALQDLRVAEDYVRQSSRL